MVMKLQKTELIQAQLALLVAVGLQVVVWLVNHDVFSEFQYAAIIAQVVLMLVLAMTTSSKNAKARATHHTTAIAMIALITLANFASLAVIITALLTNSLVNDGSALLGSALAIFFTNVIVFAIWYWEIDSPGLTKRNWTKSDKDFQFTQQNMPADFPEWKPEFFDYLFISLINSFNGATTSAHPITRHAKLLMATQASISIFTLALVVARSVGVLGS